MAAAEARAAWQRAANRYFVQEDAKRAPKLACSQSSTTRCKQVDAGPTSAVDVSDKHGLGFMPYNMNPSYFNLPSEARWWLHLDHNYDLQKGFNCGQLKAVKADAETIGVGNEKSAPIVGASKTRDIDMGSPDIVNRAVLKEHGEVKVEDTSVRKCKVEQDVLDVKDLTDYYDLMEMELVGGSASKPSSDLSYDDSSWIEGEKVPWWRKTDKDDLASFVAQKSLHHIENCDLPPTHKMHVKKELSEQSAGFDPDELFVSLQDWDGTNVTSGVYSRANPDVGNKRSEWASVDRGLSGSVPSGRMSVNYDDMINKPKHSGEDTARAQLLEALCHSQTRAREAEKAAKQAYTEKEHIVKLFFKQASQLFAYKQWFRLLQIESYMHNHNSNQPPNHTTMFPDVLIPWSPCKPHKIWKKTSEAKRRKRGLPRCDICKYAVAFALGLSLVGAGLLLGWTVGWLFPAI